MKVEKQRKRQLYRQLKKRSPENTESSGILSGEIGYILLKSLIKKVIPQLAAMKGPEITNHLFYSSIKNLPNSFSSEEKTELTTAYKKMIGEKIIPA